MRRTAVSPSQIFTSPSHPPVRIVPSGATARPASLPVWPRREVSCRRVRVFQISGIPSGAVTSQSPPGPNVTRPQPAPALPPVVREEGTNQNRPLPASQTIEFEYQSVVARNLLSGLKVRELTWALCPPTVTD